jgi:dihydroorotate dehydrogenase
MFFEKQNLMKGFYKNGGKDMLIRNVWFENVFIASGGLNFFLDGWPYDRYFKKFMPGYTVKETSKITKTSTLDPKPGFMPLTETLQPVELRPRCIYISLWSFLKCFMLNSVGLSGPGFAKLLKENIWQQNKDSFIISIMAVGKTLEERIEEIEGIVKLLKKALPKFKSRIAIELNISCPNTGHDTRKLAKEAIILLKLLEPLGIPVIVKFNLLMSIDAAAEIAESGYCHAIDIPNTCPFSELPEKVKRKLFRNGLSPLAKYNFGDSGYSGPYQTTLTANWIMRFRVINKKIPVIAGSIYKKKDVELMRIAGANAIAIGAGKLLRPWRLKGVINEAKKQFGGE